MKLIEARRERSDKISKLMGDYLLKGYKMLGVTCPACDVSDCYHSIRINDHIHSYDEYNVK